MKRAVILHGTDGSPTELAWQVWLKKQLEDSGYEVFFPLLPDNHTPDLAKYDEFLQNSRWDFTDNVVIGHSSGATALLHLLQQDWFPHIRAAVLVGTFLEESRVKSAAWYDPGQFDKLFIEEFQPGRIRSGADKFYFVHGDDDPYCDYDLARQLCEQVDGTFITIPGGGHIASASGVAELPALTAILTADGLLHSELRQLFSSDGEPLKAGKRKYYCSGEH